MLPRIQISRTAGNFSIETTPARLSCRPGRYQMNLNGNGSARLQIQTRLPRIQIDQTAAFASAGLKPMHQQAMENYARAEQKGLEAIGTIAQEGVEFLRIERRGNPIASQARAIGESDVRLTVKAMPSEGPDIQDLPGQVDIEITGGLKGDWEWVEGASEYTPYAIRVSVDPSTIEITVLPGVELQFPVSAGLGVNVDAEA